MEYELYSCMGHIGGKPGLALLAFWKGVTEQKQAGIGEYVSCDDYRNQRHYLAQELCSFLRAFVGPRKAKQNPMKSMLRVSETINYSSTEVRRPLKAKKNTMCKVAQGG